MPPLDDDEGPVDTRPYLCIPYWTTPSPTDGRVDTGEERPLSTSVVDYACESIVAGPYQPGQKLDVTVAIRNSGGGNHRTIATVVVWWAIPGADLLDRTFLAAGTVAVPTTRDPRVPAVSRTTTLSGTIPADAPDHICLLASVSHPQDLAGAPAPHSNRHWAQRNLWAVPVAVGAPVIFPFTAANPTDTAKSVQLLVGSVHDERRRALIAEAVGVSADGTDMRVRLLDEQGGEVAEGGEQVEAIFEMEAFGRRALQLMLEMGEDIPAGAGTPVEGVLRDLNEETSILGSFGVVLVPPEQG